MFRPTKDCFAPPKRGYDPKSSVFLREARSEVDPDAVLTALSKPHDREILAIAQDGPVAAQDLLERTPIPQSTLYRRINELEEAGLLEVVDTTIQGGHPVDRYRCPLRGLTVRIAEGEIKVEWDVPKETANPAP